MKELFPEASKEQRVGLLKIFSPDHHSHNNILTNMADPPSFSEFEEDLKRYGLRLEFFTRTVTSPTAELNNLSFYPGNLPITEKYFGFMRLVPDGNQVREVMLLVNSGPPVAGIDIDRLRRDTVKMIHNDVIFLIQHDGQSCYLVFDFKQKRFVMSTKRPEEVLPLDLFTRARNVLRDKNWRIANYYKRDLVFKEAKDPVEA